MSKLASHGALTDHVLKRMADYGLDRQASSLEFAHALAEDLMMPRWLDTPTRSDVAEYHALITRAEELSEADSWVNANQILDLIIRLAKLTASHQHYYPENVVGTDHRLPVRHKTTRPVG